MKRIDALNLNQVLSGVRLSGLDRDRMFSLVRAKIDLSDLSEKSAKEQEKFREETRPEGVEQNARPTAEQAESWQRAYMEMMEPYLLEKVEVSLPSLSEDELYGIIAKNPDLSAGQIETMMRQLCREGERKEKAEGGSR